MALIFDKKRNYLESESFFFDPYHQNSLFISLYCISIAPMAQDKMPPHFLGQIA